MMHKFRFGDGNGPNANAKYGATFNGNVEVYFNYPENDHCKVQISGPAGAERGSMYLDKATARKLGAALLQWAFV
jgi:hypothetical protein